MFIKIDNCKLIFTMSLLNKLSNAINGNHFYSSQRTLINIDNNKLYLEEDKPKMSKSIIIGLMSMLIGERLLKRVMRCMFFKYTFFLVHLTRLNQKRHAKTIDCFQFIFLTLANMS